MTLLTITPWVKPVSPAGVGMSATETIYNGRAALAADPYVTKTGITEDAIESVILPVAHRRVRAPNYWATLLNKRRGRRFHVAFIDSKEIQTWRREAVVINGWQYDFRQIAISFPPIRDVYAITIRMITRIIWRHQR